MNEPIREWDAMGSDWRGQAVPTIDVEALRVEATQQGRRLRLMLVLETLLAIASVIVLGWIALRANAKPVETWVFGGFALVMVPYQAYIVWIRRREWSEAGLEVDALLDVEIRRCTTTLHYWRFGMWSVMVMWLVMHGAMWLGIVLDWPQELVTDLMNLHVGAGLTIPFVGLWGVYRSRLARARGRRLAAMVEQLR